MHISAFYFFPHKHWPILSICNIIEAGLPSRTIRISAVVLSIVLATLTYYFIEPKLRYGKNGNKKALGLFLVMLAIGVYGITEYKYSYTHKIIPNFAKVEQDDTWPRTNQSCINKYPKWAEQNNPCQIETNPSKKFSVAIMGDSHSAQLLPGIYSIKKRDYNLELYSISCKVPYYNFRSSTNGGRNDAMRKYGATLWDLAFENVMKDPKVKTVVLAHNPVCSRNDITDTQNPNSALSKDELHLIGAKRTFDLLKQYNKHVIIVKDNPTLPFEPQKCKPRPIIFHKSSCSFDRSFFDKFEPRNFYNSIIEKVAKDYDNISFIDLSDMLCDNTECYLNIGNKVVYKDTNHLNKFGSDYIAPMLDEAIRKSLEK